MKVLENKYLFLLLVAGLYGAGLVWLPIGFSTIILFSPLLILIIVGASLVIYTFLLGKKSLLWGLVCLTPFVTFKSVKWTVNIYHRNEAKSYVQALEEYKIQYKHYPKELNTAKAKVPDYVLYIPDTSFSSYQVSFLKNEGFVQYYNSRNKEWESYDGRN